MNRLITQAVGVAVVLLAATAVQAELQLVVNFEEFSGNPDGQACNGVLGGTLDTESEGTGNSSLRTSDGSNTMSVIGHSSGGLARAIGFGGTDNPIADGETGIGFFRFRVDGGNVRPHMGLVTDPDGNPVNSTNTQDPTTVPAGFRLVAAGAGMDLVTLDGATVLKAGLSTGQWYNCWIVADNAADTFDLYVSEAEGPAGEPTLPTLDALVQRGLPFAVATSEPLNGMVFANPTGTGQASRIYVDEIWWDGDQGLAPPTQARNPVPSDGASDVERHPVLSWKTAPSAVAHDVYFGTSADAVAAGDATTLVGAGQDANTYAPQGPFAFGQTYYWRVDEVNGPPDNMIFPGSVWSFTTELFAYPVQPIAVTASVPASPGAQGPERSIDESGLDAMGQHSVSDADVWLGDASAGGPVWIRYDFDQVYKLYQMRVWNYNTVFESLVGFGVKGVTIEYAAEPNEWVTLGDLEFPQAPGLPDYTGNAIDLEGIAASAVRININGSWSGQTQKYGLSEVKFSYIPVNAREPQPASGTTDLDPAVVLSWRAGREAASHQVYLSTDPNAVADGSALVDTVAENTYDLPSLDLGTTYYWKVAEVNEAETPSVWISDVWDFATKEHIVIDDFEAYTDDVGSRLFDVWLDGFEVGGNGSQIGHDNQPYAERTIVNTGRQSAPFYYDNTGGVANSEIEREFASAQDWTANGADTFSFYFHGEPIGFAEPAAGTVIMNGIGTDIWGTSDQGRFVYKQLTGNGTIVARVDRLDATDPWAKAGVMIRQSPDPASQWALALQSAANGVHFQARLGLGVSATSDTSLTLPEEQTSVTTPVWVKLERVGNQFNVYYATDEAPTAWTPNPWNPQTIAMSDPVYIGLAVTSHNASAVTQAIFSGVATTGNVTGQWQSASLTVDQPVGNQADAFYVAVEDSAGKQATFFHPDPYAVGAGTWTRWAIPLSDLGAAGVNTKAVMKIYLGVGDKTKPSQNAAGVMYIDDIAFGHPAPEE
ncbi:MAG: hypothetical protein JW993_14555 [Sedimentisphaerales bacterium]|nr:hypothetical protein [Sedimentisphaerales bacterium]